jgi:hypothetical protein
MKQIVITDTEAKALLDRLELKAMRDANHWPAHSEGTRDEITNAHRAFHYIVCRWLQEMGAEVTNR